MDMCVLLYDQNIRRTKKLERYLKSHAIPIIAVWCLKDFLINFDKFSPDVFLIEYSRITYHNIHIKDIVNILGLSAIVILYKENPLTHHFKFRFMDFRILQLTFRLEPEETIIIARLKKMLGKLQQVDRLRNSAAICETVPRYCPNYHDLYEIAQLFSEPLKQLTLQLLQHTDGLTLQEIITILNPKNKKNEVNYAQTVIHKLRGKLAKTVGNRYMIYCRNHVYRLVYCEHTMTDKPAGDAGKYGNFLI